MGGAINGRKTKAGKEPVTVDRSRYKHHLQDRFDDKRLDEISPFDLERMKSEMAKAGDFPQDHFPLSRTSPGHV